MPAGGMRVLLSGVARFHGIKIGLGPEARGQRTKAEARVKLLRRFDDPLGSSSLEAIIDVSGFDQAAPFLAPAVIDPMSWNSFRDRLVIFLGQFVFRPGMQLEIERTKLGQEIIVQLYHLLRLHSVGGNLQCEVVVMPQFLRATVAQVPQLYKARF